MPSDKKRINLTIPDEVYDRLQAYKEKNGITGDASACLQLVVKQLKVEENTALMMKLVQSMSVEQLTQASKEGLSSLKDAITDSM